MAKSYRIVKDFGEAEVRSKSKSDLPKLFREWESVPSLCALTQEKWHRPRRRVNTVGHPPFDIYSEWLMDFATISADLRGRTDWQNFRRLILLQVPCCPFTCWYCFNDAWHGAPKITTGSAQPAHILTRFDDYRKTFHGSRDQEVNVLRLSGGEPFTQPTLVADLTNAFGNRYGEGDDAVLWVDTNLYPVAKGNRRDVRRAIRALARLPDRCVVHACVHAASQEGYRRSCHAEVDLPDICEALSRFTDEGVNVYPRLNPIALRPDDAERIFDAFLDVREDLPARTYLGPVELHYTATASRMRECAARRQLDAEPGRLLHPANAVLHTWDRRMQVAYGFGYGAVPRHLVPPAGAFPKRHGPAVAEKTVRTWRELLLICKGWEKEAYALKLLELLALPRGAVIEIEYENKWVEPTFAAVAHGMRSDPLGLDVLFAGAQPPSGRGSPRIVPARWGKLVALASSGTTERDSLNARVELQDYAYDFGESLCGDPDESVAQRLARYVGAANLPFGPGRGHFCQLIGLETKASEPKEGDGDRFSHTIQELVEPPYKRARRDVYYRAEVCGATVADRPLVIQDGRLLVHEGQMVTVVVEACNPNLGDEGFPDFTQTGLEILATDPEVVTISPARVRLSKFGSSEVHVAFARKGERQGALLLRPTGTEARLAQVSIPYLIQVRS